MSLSKIVGGILLVVAGSGTAPAQRMPTAVAIQNHYAPNQAAGRTAFNGDAGWHGPHDDGRDGDRHRHGRHLRGYWPFVGYDYWGAGGYVYTEESRDMFGYFATGGDVSLFKGEAFYDYDRSYPYDWFNESGTHAATSANGAGDYRCQTSLVQSGQGGSMTPIRVCRR